MPPKQKQKQKQKQSQRVVVNIGTNITRTRRKRVRKTSQLPPASYQNNLTPTIIQQPQQSDYSSLIKSLFASREQAKNTPLNTSITQSIQTTETPLEIVERQREKQETIQMRREGKTSAEFQPLPSEADERLAAKTQEEDDVKAAEALRLKAAGISSQVQTAQAAEKTGQGESGGGIPTAVARAEARVTGTSESAPKSSTPHKIRTKVEIAADKAAADKAAAELDPKQRTLDPYLKIKIKRPNVI